MTNYERLVMMGELGTFIRNLLNINSCIGTERFMEDHHINQKSNFPNYGECIANWLQSECEYASYVRTTDIIRILDEAEANNSMLSGITSKDYILNQLGQCEVKIIREGNDDT